MPGSRSLTAARTSSWAICTRAGSFQASAAFSSAFEDFSERVERGEEVLIDDYAADDPGEFFAVMSEAFFLHPHDVQETYPEVYGQLVAFYRQDPGLRLGP